MAFNNFKCNHLMTPHFKALKSIHSIIFVVQLFKGELPTCMYLATLVQP